jgi:peptidylprolyl isomerase
MATSKRERQKAARREKQERMQRYEKRRKNIRRAIIVGVIAVVVIVSGALLFSGGKSTTSTTTTTIASAGGTTTTAPTTTTTSPTSTSTSSTIANSYPPVKDPSPVGTWGTAPTVVVPAGAPPTGLEVSNLINGSGLPAEQGSTLTVQYVLATYSTRKVVQSSWTSKAFGPFSLSTTGTATLSGVIPGWVDGLVGMRVGGRRELVIPPSLGYGDQSPGSGIAANDTLVFVVDLLKVSS